MYKAGQHTIEYITLLTLITAGIIIMGPYVIRSWNANLKGWEDSAIDSLQDPLLEAGVNAVSLSGCDALPPGWIDEGCNLARINPCTDTFVSCSEVEMLSRIDYSPAGCQCNLSPPVTSVKCTVNSCCCTVPVSTGRCGAAADFVPGEQKEPLCNRQMTSRNDDGTCPDGMAEAWTLCGSDVDPTDRRYGCIDDDACVFTCTSPPPVLLTPEYGALCPNDDTGLIGDTPNSFVLDGACTIAQKCETECAVGFFPLPPGGVPTTYCGPCPNLGISNDGCPAGRYDTLGCPITRFKACCYSLF